MNQQPAPEFVRVGLESNDYPPRLRAALGSAAPKYLYVSGNLGLLNNPVMGLLAARQVDPTSLHKTAQAFKDLIAAGVCIVGGWHSPLEVSLLEGAKTAHSMLGILLATGCEHATLPTRLRECVESGEGFALTHCGPAVRRVTRTAALRRNDFVVALSDALLVPAAPAGSATLGVAKRALAAGKPVLTIDLTVNRELLSAGARGFTQAILADALAKSSANQA